MLLWDKQPEREKEKRGILVHCLEVSVLSHLSLLLWTQSGIEYLAGSCDRSSTDWLGRKETEKRVKVPIRPSEHSCGDVFPHWAPPPESSPASEQHHRLGICQIQTILPLWVPTFWVAWVCGNIELYIKVRSFILFIWLFSTFESLSPFCEDHTFTKPSLHFGGALEFLHHPGVTEYHKNLI